MSSFVDIPKSATPQSLDIESLKRRCLGRADLACRVLERFRVTVEDDIALIDQAIAAGDLSEVARVAHRVKGSSLSVSAHNLAEFSHRLECRALTVASNHLLPPTESHPALESLETLETLWCELRSEYAAVSKLATPTAEGPK